MNVEGVDQPKAAPHGLQGRGVAGMERPRMDGKRRTPVSPAVEAGEGWSILPAKESSNTRRVSLHKSRCGQS